MFSEREEKILDIIRSKGSLTVREITTKVFKNSSTAPFDSEISISNSINRINNKCKHYKLSWFLEKRRIDKKIHISLSEK